MKPSNGICTVFMESLLFNTDNGNNSGIAFLREPFQWNIYPYMLPLGKGQGHGNEKKDAGKLDFPKKINFLQTSFYTKPRI
jgi:hypothetical protein